MSARKQTKTQRTPAGANLGTAARKRKSPGGGVAELAERVKQLEARVDVWGAELSERVAGKAEPESYRGPLPTEDKPWELGAGLRLWAPRSSWCCLNVGNYSLGGSVNGKYMTEPELRRELARWLPLRRGEG